MRILSCLHLLVNEPSLGLDKPNHNRGSSYAERQQPFLSASVIILLQHMRTCVNYAGGPNDERRVRQ